MLSEKINEANSKVFTKKSIPIIMLICAAVIFVVQIFNVCFNFGEGFLQILYVLACIVWSLFTLGILVLGIIKKEEKFITLGFLFLLPFLINAFSNAFYALCYIDYYFDDSFLFGLTYVFNFVVYLLIAGGFIIWVLNNFFNLKINNILIVIFGIIAIALTLIKIIFHIIDAEPIEFWISSFSIMAEIVLFLAELSRRNN